MMRTKSELPQKPLAHGWSLTNSNGRRRIASYLENASCALLRRRSLSTIAACSFVWLASLWMAAALAQAQELPAKGSVAATDPSFARRIEKPQAPPLLELSMIDRGNVEPDTLAGPAVRANVRPSNPPNPAEPSSQSIPRGPEYTSLAALASAPPSTLLNSVRTKSPEQANDGSLPNDNKAFVYRLGALDLVINRLPGRFSISSPPASPTAPR